MAVDLRFSAVSTSRASFARMRQSLCTSSNPIGRRHTTHRNTKKSQRERWRSDGFRLGVFHSAPTHPSLRSRCCTRGVARCGRLFSSLPSSPLYQCHLWHAQKKCALVHSFVFLITCSTSLTRDPCSSGYGGASSSPPPSLTAHRCVPSEWQPSMFSSAQLLAV